MIRITDLKLPLHHADEALPAAIVKRLRITPRDLIRFTVARRGADAREHGKIALVYTLDVAAKNEGTVLARNRRDRDVSLTPDTRYRAPAPATKGAPRPVVIGAGPCGLFAALILAQGGYRPIVLERGKVVRERTKDTWGLWRRSVLNPESNVQ